MKYHSITWLLVGAALAACSPTVTVTSRQTGQIGTGTISGAEFGNSGKMTLSFGEEVYSGTWLAVRDTGFLRASSDAGTGNAVLRSTKGNRMSCEFKYSLVTMNALGACIKNEQETFDLQASMI